jgi:phage baseplate assembly protein gpV
VAALRGAIMPTVGSDASGAPAANAASRSDTVSSCDGARHTYPRAAHQSTSPAMARPPLWLPCDITTSGQGPPAAGYAAYTVRSLFRAASCSTNVTGSATATVATVAA